MAQNHIGTSITGIVCPANASPELKREYGRLYYKVRREHVRKRTKLYRELHREKMMDFDRKYYHNNVNGRKDKLAAKRRSLEGKFAIYSQGALRRGVTFELSMEDFRLFWDKPCYYCGKVISPPTIGIDRKDCTKGYTLENCVPSCWECNRAKGKLNHVAFIGMCKEVAKKHA